MHNKVRCGVALIIAACTGLLLWACNRAPEPAQGENPTRPSVAAVPATAPNGQSVISFKSDPDPPRTGDNISEVILKLADGTVVTDAKVSVVYHMPAMPSMNMPEMRATAVLPHVGDGVYRGTTHLVMGGTWNVTVTARRGSEKIAGKKFSVIAK